MSANKKIPNARGVSKRTRSVQDRGPVKAGARSIPTYEDLRIALDESVKLQSHYAKLLNMYDAGKRREFPTTDLWLARLRETGTLRNSPALPGRGDQGND